MYIPKPALKSLYERLRFIKCAPKVVLSNIDVSENFPDARCLALDPNILPQEPIDLVISHCALDPEHHYLYFKTLKDYLSPEGFLLFSLQGREMHTVGDMLLQLGFSDPVMDREVYSIEYKTLARLQRDFGDIDVQPNQEGFYAVPVEMIYGHAMGEKPQTNEVSFPISELRRMISQ